MGRPYWLVWLALGADYAVPMLRRIGYTLFAVSFPVWIWGVARSWPPGAHPMPLPMLIGSGLLVVSNFLLATSRRAQLRAKRERRARAAYEAAGTWPADGYR